MIDRTSAMQRVSVAFDADAGVWRTVDSTVLGLNAQADTLEALLRKIVQHAEALVGTRMRIER